MVEAVELPRVQLEAVVEALQVLEPTSVFKVDTDKVAEQMRDQQRIWVDKAVAVLSVALGAEAHLNSSFKHFVYFTQAFALVEPKELAPLQARAGGCAPRARGAAGVGRVFARGAQPAAAAASSQEMIDSINSSRGP